MALPWPSDLCAGTVVWRLAGMKADDHDPDRDPQLIAGEGIEVTFSPDVSTIVGYRGVEGKMSIMPFISSGVIDSQGYLCTKQLDGSAGDRGVVLPATDCDTLNPRDWTYTVTITDNRIRVDRFSVKVETGTTLDLYDFIKVGATAGTKIISEVQTAERAEAARDDAEGYRDEVAQNLNDMVISGEVLEDNLFLERFGGGEPIDAGNVRGPVGPEGPQGPMGTLELIGGDNPSITVDTSVGTRIMIGDTMIHGDTGWREVGAHLPEDIKSKSSDGIFRVYLRRENSTVYLSVDYLRLSDSLDPNTALLHLPTGYRPTHPIRIGSGATYELGSAIYTSGNGAELRIRDSVSSGLRRFYISWPASANWPTSLPGSPA